MLRQKFLITMFFELSTLYIRLPLFFTFSFVIKTLSYTMQRYAKHPKTTHACFLPLVISLILGPQPQA